MVMQHIPNMLPNIYCHPAELSFLHCIVILCDCMMRGILKFRGAVIENELVVPYRFAKVWNVEKHVVAGEISYQCHHCPGAHSVVI